eukprot:jgi/Bigna1/126231/aug1.2_g939
MDLGGFQYETLSNKESALLAKIKPVFGSSTSKDTASSSTAAASSSSKGEAESKEKDKEYPEVDYDKQWNIKTEVELPDVQFTGEGEEDVIWESKTQLFRMSNDSEWKQRAVGSCRMLKHKETGKIRLTVRDNKILKIRANHFILPGTVVVPHKQCSTAFVYSTPDFTDGASSNASLEIFCFRFETDEEAAGFQSNFTAAAKQNEKVFNLELGDNGEEEDDEDGDEEPVDDKKDEGDADGDDEDDDGEKDGDEQDRPYVPGLNEGEEEADESKKEEQEEQGKESSKVVDELTGKMGDVQVDQDKEGAEE